MANTMISLQCGHVVYFSTKALPDTGERIWCVRCQHYRRVTSDTHVYTLRCYGTHGTRHGNYRRTFGHLRFTAEQACIQHRLKHPTHTVVLLQDGKVIATYAAQERALPGMGLSALDTDPPF